MALDGNTLGDAIKAAIDGTDPTDRTALFRAIGNAIVTHVTTNAVVTTTGTTATHTPGAAAPTTGSGTVA